MLTTSITTLAQLRSLLHFWFPAFYTCTLQGPHLWQPVWSFKKMSDHVISYSKSSNHLPSHSGCSTKSPPVRPYMTWPSMFCEQVKHTTWGLRTFALVFPLTESVFSRYRHASLHSFYLGFCSNGNSLEKPSLVKGSKQLHHLHSLLYFSSQCSPVPDITLNINTELLRDMFL